MYYSIKPSGRNYSYVENDGKPLYPFGYGLSYTTFEYSDFQVPENLDKEKPLKVSVRVRNIGKVAGDEVVQVYMHDELASVARPLKELVAFKRVTLNPGESKVVEFTVTPDKLMFLDKKTAEGYVNHYGAERLAFGTDYPVWDPVQEVKRLEALNLTEEQKEQIAWKTAARFLDL